MSVSTVGGQGIPAQSLEAILGKHQDLIDRIKVCYGMDRVRFEQDMLCLIHRYAAFVHLLPATPDNYFSEPGGMLRMGLEVAFFSLQGTDAHIFSGRSTISIRRHLEPRWRQATFIAGLCSTLHHALSHVVVSDEEGNEWQAYLLPLSEWLVQHQVSRYFVKWCPDAPETRAPAMFVLPQVVTAEALQHLAADNSVIVPHMMASISGVPLYRDHNMLDDLVRRSVALVIDRDLETNAARCRTTNVGSHLVRYLTDALRRLVSTHSAWRPNGEKSRVWFGSDGLFVVWPNAAVDIQCLLESDNLAGIPKSPDAILEILLATGVLESNEASEPIWKIVPPKTRNEIEAVKVCSPATLLTGIDPIPQPLECALCVSSGTATRSTPSTAPFFQQADTSTHPPLQVDPALTEMVDEVPPPSNRSDDAVATGEMNAGSSGQLPLALPEFSLDAPMRLHPAVRRALAHIVHALNQNGAHVAANTLSTGFFIPLVEFELRHVEPSLALRALSELKMLLQQADSPSWTVTRNADGEQKVGLLLDPRFITGIGNADPGTAYSVGK